MTDLEWRYWFVRQQNVLIWLRSRERQGYRYVLWGNEVRSASTPIEDKTMIVVNSPETLRQYRKDCAADRRRAHLAETAVSEPISHFEHDSEFVGKTIYVPPQLAGMELSKNDLRLLVV